MRRTFQEKVTSALKSEKWSAVTISEIMLPMAIAEILRSKNHLLAVDPETAPIVQQIFEWRAAGVSYMGINKKLNDAGIPSPVKKFDSGIVTNNNQDRRSLNKHKITEILNDIVYIGHLACLRRRAVSAFTVASRITLPPRMSGL